jgi:hypothetical protein
MNDLSFFVWVALISLYFFQKGIHKHANHEPNLRCLDACDRVCQWLLVVSLLWLLVVITEPVWLALLFDMEPESSFAGGWTSDG